MALVVVGQMLTSTPRECSHSPVAAEGLGVLPTVEEAVTWVDAFP